MIAPRLRTAALLGPVLLLVGCGATSEGSPAAGDAEESARAACAAIDAMPLGGTEVEPIQAQVQGFTAAAEHLRAAADADSAYADDAEVAAAMASRAADALAILEEHGEDPDAWDAEVQRDWGAYVFDQVDGVMHLIELCNVVDPPNGRPGERAKEATA